MEGRRGGAWFRRPAVTTYAGDGSSKFGTGGYYPPAVHHLNSNLNLQSPNFYHLLQNPAHIPNLHPGYSNSFIGTSNFPMHQQNLKFPPRQIPNFSSQNPSSSSQNPSLVPRLVGNNSRKVKGKSCSQSDKRGRKNKNAHSEIKSERIVSEKTVRKANRRVVPNKSFDKRKHEETMGRIDGEVSEVRKAMAVAGESVSSFKVWQTVTSKLGDDSWQSLGIQMQDIPSLRKLITLEGKINAFIHCFVGVRNIATLFDLEVAICEIEGINHFDDLELGPLLQHQLVLLYFQSNTGVTKPFKITSEEIISLLEHFVDISRKTDVKIDEFLNFIAKEKSLAAKEKLGVRIQNLGMYVTFIQGAKRQEAGSLKNFLSELQKKYGHFSSSKEQQDDLTFTVTQQLESFPFVHKDFRGKHTRFDTLRSDNDDGEYIKDENIDNDAKTVDISGNVSSCPHPSASEEMKCLGSSSKTRKSENLSPTASEPAKMRKRKRKIQETVKSEKLMAAEVSPVGDEGPKSRLTTAQPRYDFIAEAAINPCSQNLLSASHESGFLDLSGSNQLHGDTAWAAQAVQTGRLGEQIAFKYFADKCSKSLVKWVNEYNETGLPYDIIIEDRDGKRQYIEVKATISVKKFWFNISVREWGFACEKGEAFSVAHVLLGNNDAILTQHSNPVRLCQEGRLQLVILMPNQQNEFKIV